MALQYGSLGAHVICIDINEKGNQETVAAIKSKGGQAHGYTLVIVFFSLCLLGILRFNFLKSILKLLIFFQSHDIMFLMKLIIYTKI